MKFFRSSLTSSSSSGWGDLRSTILTRWNPISVSMMPLVSPSFSLNMISSISAGEIAFGDKVRSPPRSRLTGSSENFLARNAKSSPLPRTLLDSFDFFAGFVAGGLGCAFGQSYEDVADAHLFAGHAEKYLDSWSRSASSSLDADSTVLPAILSRFCQRISLRRRLWEFHLERTSCSIILTFMICSSTRLLNWSLVSLLSQAVPEMLFPRGLRGGVCLRRRWQRVFKLVQTALDFYFGHADFLVLASCRRSFSL